MKKRIQLFVFLSVLFASAVSFTGCATTLDPQGVYHGDKVTYVADEVTVSLFEVLDGFTEWELRNRAVLSDRPKVHAFAQKIRTEAPTWFASLSAVKKAYAANPTAANKQAFEQALAVIRAAVTEATIYLTNSSAAKGQP